MCHYCTFARPPRRGERSYLAPDEVLDIARAGAAAGCHEALFTLGDKPELRYRAARAELTELGFETTIEYLAHVAGLASLAFRGWLMLREIWLRPTFPWDAWDAWAVKSKTWFLLGHYAPFVSMPDWLAHPAQELYTGVAWAYPATLAWMQIWFASAAGGWIEPQVNLPWFALWIGLLLGHYGQWRALGLDRVRALAAMYALGSLPLLDVHVALAGYADLWLAAMLGFAALAWLRWRRERDPGQLAIAVVCAALLPAFKLEGAIWLLLPIGLLAIVPIVLILLGLRSLRRSRRAERAYREHAERRAGLTPPGSFLSGLRFGPLLHSHPRH